MNRSETATAKTPFTAATKTLMNLPPKATDIGTEHYQFGVTPGTGEGPRNEAQNLAFLAFLGDAIQQQGAQIPWLRPQAG
jgi:hypothetical protein